MNNTVEWIGGTKITEEQLILVQEQLSITYPEDFREFILKNSGAGPFPHSYNFEGRDEAVLNNIFDFDLETEYNVIEEYGFIKDRIAEDVFPFGRDPFGNFICFDYRKDSTSPTVVFWDHELSREDSDNLKLICNTFTEFIDKLYEA